MIPIKKLIPQKIGNSHYFRIPAQYINNEIISVKKCYNANIEETKKS